MIVPVAETILLKEALSSESLLPSLPIDVLSRMVLHLFPVKNVRDTYMKSRSEKQQVGGDEPNEDGVKDFPSNRCSEKANCLMIHLQLHRRGFADPQTITSSNLIGVQISRRKAVHCAEFSSRDEVG